MEHIPHIQANLMKSPLVSWVSLFKSRDGREDDSQSGSLTYKELYDGAYLLNVMQQIYHRRVEDSIVTLGAKLDESTVRLQNWSCLMKSIKSFYRDELQQMIVMKLPDIIHLSREPEEELTCDAVRITLLLILGCAVQSERKQYFVSQIRDELSEEVQEGIMEHLKEVTENFDNFVSSESPIETIEQSGKMLYYHLNRALEERDLYIEEATKATVESEIYLAELDELRGLALPSPTSPEKHHLAVELAEYKAKERRLRLDLEEKQDQTQELKDEIEEYKKQLVKLREENLSLTQDARSARACRDELDIIQEKARKVEKLERQLQTFKDKMHELDFFKARVDELREDNKILIETKLMLEDQLSTSQKRVETIIDLENELMRLKKEREESLVQHDESRRLISELKEYISRLEYDKNSTLNESANLEEELALSRGLASSELSQSLRDQLSDTVNSEILRLELENQRLQKLLNEQREVLAVENSSHLLELEKENQRLALKVEKLLENTTKSSQEVMQLEEEKLNFQRQAQELKNTVEAIKDSADRQVKELERENVQLSSTIDALRQRNEQSIDLRVKDVEKENERLSDTVQEVTHQLSKLDYDYRTLQKNHVRLQEQVGRVQQVEQEKEKCERENSELSKHLVALQLTVEKYEMIEQELSDKEVENKKLIRQLENLQLKLEYSEQQVHENINLTVENQRLSKLLQASKDSATQLLELEHEKADKEKEIISLQKTIQVLKDDTAKVRDLEVKLHTSEGEIHRLSKTMELINKKLESKTQEYEELHEENRKLEGTIEALRLSIRKLEEVEKDNRNLEETNAALQHEQQQKDKEIKKLRQTLEVKEGTIDEYSAKVALLERDHKSLKRSGEKWRQASVRFREQEGEANSLLEKSKTDRKTIAALREELVQEKIKLQQVTNELENLKAELQSMGFTKDKLQAQANIADEDLMQGRLKVLQEMMEEAHKKSLQIKDDKIKNLENHLEESKQLTATLTRQLDVMQKEYEAFIARRREETTPVTTTINVQQSPGKPSSSISQLVIKKPQNQTSTQEFLTMQNELIQIQKKNATLLSENAGLKSQAAYTEERMKKLESHMHSNQQQVTTLTGEKNSLQAQYAQLQVENTTLQSKLNSLLKQNTSLQQQLAKLQSDFEETAISHQELNDTYDSLVADHEQLQHLNETLSSEYETLISEHGTLKSQYKQLREEMTVTRRVKEDLSREKATIEELRQSLYKEKRTSIMDLTMADDVKRLNEENQMIKQQSEKVRGEYRDLLSEYKTIKTEYNQMKLKHTELKGDMADCRDQVNKLDIQNAKLTNKCEDLERLVSKLEEENRQLIFQLQALLQQNQELLSTTLETSEHFREEEMSYRDQVANLRRAKEKLEEKIMDQYKNYDRTKQKKTIGSEILKKAKHFIAKRHMTQDKLAVPSKGLKDLTKSQLDLTLGLLPNTDDTVSLSAVSISSRGSSKGSDSGGPDNVTFTKSNKAGASEVVTPRDGSVSDRTTYSTTVNHRLTTDHRKMAISSTALNVPVTMGPLREVSVTIPKEDLQRVSGARSTDDLANSPMTSNQGRDRYSIDQGSSRLSNAHRPDRYGSGVEDIPTKDYDEMPTKDVGLRGDSIKSNNTSLFYTPPFKRTTGREGGLEEGESSGSDHVHEEPDKMQRSRLEYRDRVTSHDSINSSKPDLVMGTDSSPRGLVYYDPPQAMRPGQMGGYPSTTSTPKVITPREQQMQAGMSNSRSNPNMYASLDSRLDVTRREQNLRLDKNQASSAQGSHLLPKSKSMASTSSLVSQTNGIRSPASTDPSQQQTRPAGKEENSTWYEYGCV